MDDREKPPLALAPLLAELPEESGRIKESVLWDEELRDIAEDFLLAHKTLQHLRDQPVVDHAKVTDYVNLMSQLENDVRKHLSRPLQKLR